MACLALCGFFLCFLGGAAAFAAPSVEEMAGQMLLVGFKGQEPEECGAILKDGMRATPGFLAISVMRSK